jgi:hypothetical protein
MAGRRGVALMEVIIAGVILAMGLTVIISLASRSMAMQASGEKRLIASWLADELLGMVVVEGPQQYPRLYDTSGRCDVPFDAFTFDLDIQDQGLSEPFRVTASIRWQEGRLTRDVTVQTLIADRGSDIEVRLPAAPVDRLERWYGEEEGAAQ